jgi:hypothetical protein
VGAYVDRPVAGQTVAQRMQCRQQSQAGSLSIVPAEAAHEIVDPFVGRMDRCVEASNGRHGLAMPPFADVPELLSCVKNTAQARHAVLSEIKPVGPAQGSLKQLELEHFH